MSPLKLERGKQNTFRKEKYKVGTEFEKQGGCYILIVRRTQLDMYKLRAMEALIVIGSLTCIE